ncbi:plasma membrane calcium, partial [Quaeritorhiza haematococci]
MDKGKAEPAATATTTTTATTGAGTAVNHHHHHEPGTEAANIPNNPFLFSPTQLEALFDGKNIKLLKEYGEVEGILAGLFVDPKTGLCNMANDDPSKDPLDQHQHGHPQTSPKATHDNLHGGAGAGQAAIADGAGTTPTPADRRRVFGRNVLPPVRSKTIFELMWLAMQDKIL